MPIAYCLYCLLPIAYTDHCLLPIAYCLLPISYIAYSITPDMEPTPKLCKRMLFVTTIENLTLATQPSLNLT